MLRLSQRALFASVLLVSTAEAQFDYSLALDLPGRTWSVRANFDNAGGGNVEYSFARWTPGAYHIADYGRFVETLQAWNGDGTELEVERLDDSNFVIHAAGAVELTVGYEAASISEGLLSHGAIIDVESNRIRDDYAYVTPVSLFGFVPSRMREPFSLAVELPEGWKSATVLPQDEHGVFHAESFQRFEDSPLFFSPTLKTVEIEAGGKPLFVTVHGKGGQELEDLVEACQRISEAAIGLMGGAPYDRYHYLLGFVPEAGGSGLEHSFSTLILANPGAPGYAVHGLIAHEFFHLYCAERIHVEGIREVDFTKPLETQTIWVNESMTEYMTQLILFHAGFMDEGALFSAVGPSPITAQLAGLGAPTAVSRDAWRWEQMRDLMRFAGKMYQHGPRLIFALDMEMRRQSGGERGVVDFLKHLMAEYDAKGRGFPEDGVLEILDHVAGGDLSEFYATYVDAPGDPDFANHVDVIGCQVLDGEIVPLDTRTPEQQAAWDDYFSIDG